MIHKESSFGIYMSKRFECPDAKNHCILLLCSFAKPFICVSCNAGGLSLLFELSKLVTRCFPHRTREKGPS